MAAMAALQSSFTSFSHCSNSFLGQRFSSPSLVHIVQKGVVQQLVEMLQSPQAPVRESAFVLGAASVASQWLELLHQDTKGRLVALRRCKKRDQSVIHTELPLLTSWEFSCNQNNDPYVMKNSAVGCSNNASVHADVHQARWSAPFEQIDKGLSEEEKQLTRNATGLVAPAIAAGLGAITHTFGTLVPMIGVSGFATAVAATAIGTVVGSLDNLLIVVDMFRKLDMHSFGWFKLFVQFRTYGYSFRIFGIYRQ